MRVRTGSVALLLAACACSAGESDAAVERPTFEPRDTTAATAPPATIVAGDLTGAELGEPHLGEVSFGMPVDCSVPVTEQRVESSGLELDIAYELTFASEGENVVASMEDIVIHRAVLEGREVPASLVPPAAAMRATVVAAPDATVVEVRGIDELLAAVPDVPPDLVPVMEETFRVDAVDKSWDVWFGVWADWGVVTGPTEETVNGEGTADELGILMESLGTTADGRAAFRLTGTYGDEAVAAMAAAIFPDLGNFLEGAEMEVTDVIETVTDPGTLRPASTFHERRMVLDDGTGPIEEFERRTTQFDWEASTCD